ncbi:photosynthetic reaction center cytochrome c subunit [Leptolyngbya sp. 15MV]|nr:photosynthetic reaction center cytochrome c subunit [Leptolyngbya sp. 15MV]
MHVVLPVYHEGDHCHEVVHRVVRFAAENPAYSFLFVDDGSRDHTPRAIRQALRHEAAASAEAVSRVHVLRHRFNGGKGWAVSRGVRATRGADDDLLIFTDGDLAYSLDHLPRIAAGIPATLGAGPRPGPGPGSDAMNLPKLSWTAQALIGLVCLFSLYIVVTSFERPPIVAQQLGYRGTAMEQLTNPRIARAVAARNQLPEAQPAADPPADDADKASAVYQNVQVLGDLSNAQFLRIMVAITEWVVPQEIRDAGNGCNYCHNPENMASDEVYTKGVSRRMLQMTRTINADWSSHVQQTGVTCYTCHRGLAIPQNVWGTMPDLRDGMVGPTGQNRVARNINSSSLPFDPYTRFLLGDDDIRNISTQWRPGTNSDDIRTAEWTYALMIHMSQGLGVNCTYCHNSRAFSQWDQSPPARLTAWHGIRMTRVINREYVEPLTPVWQANPRGPAEYQHGNRLGPHGDALKVNCTTCHQGVNRPLLGAPMLRDYPELNAVGRGPLRTSEAAPRN